MVHASSSTLRLPACERCRKNKTKCDLATPKCSSCIKGAASCVIVDTSTGDRYSREQLQRMQQRLEELQTLQTERESITSTTQVSVTSPASPSVQRNPFVGDGSGVEMFHRVSTNASTAEARATILEQLNIQSPRHTFSVPDHHLPSFEMASTLIERYCSHAHLLHPLMTKRSLRQTLHRVYSSGPGSATQQDLYLIFMVSAISSVTLFRKGSITEHPYGFYRSASRLLRHLPLVGSVQAVQNLLLIARFAMYYHIECSIWDVTRLCMRQCVELGLHLPPVKPLPAMEEQMRRNVFWDCYVHDRYSSNILGRPFAISESDIEVELPIQASEEQILLSGCDSLDQIKLDQLVTPCEASIFHFVIRLRRIASRCQARFFSPRRLSTLQPRSVTFAGEILSDLKHFLGELESCLKNAPTFAHPQTLYEKPEWHLFMVEKDKLSVIRGASTNLALCDSHLPQDLLILSLECASQVIELYADLFSTGTITWTRSYFQILFTAGLSAIYSLSQLKGDPELNLIERTDRASRALNNCSRLLFQFISEMPDAGRFAVVFEALSKPYINAEHQTQQQFAWPEITDQNRVYQIGTVAGDAATINPYGNEGVQNSNHMTVNGLKTGYTQFDFAAFEVDLANMEDWSLFPTTTNNFLGQMEAGIGQYAWGMQTDADAWQQYISNGNLQMGDGFEMT